MQYTLPNCTYALTVLKLYSKVTGQYLACTNLLPTKRCFIMKINLATQLMKMACFFCTDYLDINANYPVMIYRVNATFKGY